MSDSPAPPDGSYPAPSDGSYAAPDGDGWPVPVPAPRPAPPRLAPPRANRCVIVAAAAVAAVLVLGVVGAAVRSMGSSPHQGPGSMYQAPAGPVGRIDVSLSGGINEHFVGTPGASCGARELRASGTQLLQLDTANSAHTIQFVVQVVPYRGPGTFTAPAQVVGIVNYRPSTGGTQVLNARSGQLRVSASGSKLSGEFDLRLSGPAVPATWTWVTGTFTCG